MYPYDCHEKHISSQQVHAALNKHHTQQTPITPNGSVIQSVRMLTKNHQRKLRHHVCDRLIVLIVFITIRTEVSSSHVALSAHI